MAMIAAPTLPACFRCGCPGRVPLRHHALAICEACYVAALRTEVTDPGDTD